MPTVETVLNQPLSGAEVKQIILSKLQLALDGDSRLADYIAFPSFRFRLDLAIILNGAVQNEVSIVKEDGRGALDEGMAQAVTHHVEQEELPPNEARVDADIPVPVLTTDEKGRMVERGIKYDKERLKRRKAQQAAADEEQSHITLPGIRRGNSV